MPEINVSEKEEHYVQHWSVPTVRARDRLVRTEKNTLVIAYIALFSALLSRLTALACGST